MTDGQPGNDQAKGTLTAPVPQEDAAVAPASPGPAAAPAPALAAPKEFRASIYGPDRLPSELVEAVQATEAAFGLPVWMLIQEGDGTDPMSWLEDEVRDEFLQNRDALRACGDNGVVLIIHSGGGSGGATYQLARLFQRHCGGFVAIVPSYAKSAATLLALGAREMYMGRDAEIGPLDAQIPDPEREEVGSALNEVQALERLHTAVSYQVDETIILLQGRTQKKAETLLPMVLHFVAEMNRPLVEKIDTIHYTQLSRILKVAEEYALRLLSRAGYPRGMAQMVARRLVHQYSEHGFVIDAEEAATFMRIATPTDPQRDAVDKLESFLIATRITAIGRLEEVTGSA